MSEARLPSAARVLVVDDQPVNIKLLRTILTASGYKVLEATSGTMALELLHKEQPDAMLLDVSMPGMTGYEVCEAVRRDPTSRELPVLMVTGLSLPEERARGFEAGANEFITKPFDRRELLTRLRASLKLTDGVESALLESLPGALVLTDTRWNILGLSSQAALLLSLPRPAVGAFAFAELFDPPTLAAAESGSEFRFEMSGRWLRGLQLSIGEPGGPDVMRVISLREQ